VKSNLIGVQDGGGQVPELIIRRLKTLTGTFTLFENEDLQNIQEQT